MMTDQISGSITGNASFNGVLSGTTEGRVIYEKGPCEDEPVRFYGLDGELLYSYTLEEAQQLKKLPNLPSYEGLICQGWNWSLENIQLVNHEVDVGAIFITDDGSTRIYVNLVEGGLDPYLGFGQEEVESVMVDWGDGSPLETSNVEGATVSVHMQHHYIAPGEYIIRLIPKDDAKIYLLGDSYATKLLHKVTEYSRKNELYKNAIKRVELGRCIVKVDTRAFNTYCLEYVTIPQEIKDISTAFKECWALKYVALPQNVTSLSTEAFKECCSLKKISFPDSFMTIGTSCFDSNISLERLVLQDTFTFYDGVFSGCVGLKKITVPKDVTKLNKSMFSGCHTLNEVNMNENTQTIGNKAFYECYRLERIPLPDSLQKIDASAFSYCRALREIRLPSGVTRIESNAFYNCYSLAEMIIPEGVTYIGSLAFSGCYGIENYYLLSETPPTLANVNAFSSISDTCIFHVKKGFLEGYQTAANWSNYAERMVEMET